MKAIVFGGAGFVGSHVADALSKAGHRVTVFDLKASPHLKKGQRMVTGDVLDAAAVARAVRGQDVVYHFAGLADIEAARHRPLDTAKANILGTATLLEAAREARVKRFVFASTVYVYSGVGSFYRASKQACEAYIESYREVYGLPYTILRFGSLYGPRSDDRNGIHRLLRQAMEEKKIVYWGDGEEVREYIHVEDAAASSVQVLDRSFADQCVILTGSQPLKVKDLLVMMREILGGKVKLIFKPGSHLAATHYKMTPYSFLPKEGKKLVPSRFTDLGQGLLSLAGELHRRRGER